MALRVIASSLCRLRGEAGSAIASSAFAMLPRMGPRGGLAGPGPASRAAAAEQAPQLGAWACQLAQARGMARKKPGSSQPGGPDVGKAKDDGRVQVVLLQSVPSLGVKGSVVSANAGWMRHELFPKGRAVYATPENVQQHSMSAEQRAAASDPEKLAARRTEKLLQALRTMVVHVSRRSNWYQKEPTKMLGAVTAWDICQAAEKQYGVRLHESHIFIDGPIRSFGAFKIPLNLRTKDDRQVELTVDINSVRWIRHGSAAA